MRHEVLYQYDLPIEVLDDIPRTEEVLEVLYARSREKLLVPILLTRLRILWAYPERETVYRLYEMQYVDLMSVHVRFARALTPTMTITTVNNQKYLFHGIKSRAEEVRAGLLTLREMMMQKVGGNWRIAQRRNLILEEYMLMEGGSGAVKTEAADDDLFEEEPLPGKGCFESTDTLFSHFPADSRDDVFEGDAPAASAASDEALSSAMVTRVTRMVQQTAEEKKDAEPAPVPAAADADPAGDAVIYDSDKVKMDDQWHEEIIGDAMILPGGRARVGGAKYKHMTDDNREVFRPEDDDSEVYAAPAHPKPVVKKTVCSPPPAPRRSVTLEPREGMDDAAIDKSLDALKCLRENGIISDEEYKDRCLMLFKKSGI